MLPEALIRRGSLIVIEGADRVGKSTHADMLIDALTRNDQSVKLMKFPERTTPTGSLINSYLKGQQKLNDQAVHLLFSANRWEMVDEMRKAINAGTTLIVDRYAYSGVAYSASKEGLSLEWCKTSDSGLPRPDLVLYMTLSSEKLALRQGFGDEIYESLDFQNKVKANYARLVEDNWKIISADDCDMTGMHEKLLTLVQKTIKDSANKPLQKLWV
ncbi:Thymidylate kinase [Halotydeus destructor]|nr:Thymidylate kinase [Halotydeus destructor]